MERSVFDAGAHITHASFRVAGKAETGVDADQIGIGDVTHFMLPFLRLLRYLERTESVRRKVIRYR